MLTVTTFNADVASVYSSVALVLPGPATPKAAKEAVVGPVPASVPLAVPKLASIDQAEPLNLCEILDLLGRYPPKPKL